jgi:hypothetical protein
VLRSTEAETVMRHLVFAAALALCPVLAAAADSPDWAYPVTPRPEPADNLILKQVPRPPISCVSSMT